MDSSPRSLARARIPRSSASRGVTNLALMASSSSGWVADPAASASTMCSRRLADRRGQVGDERPDVALERAGVGVGRLGADGLDRRHHQVELGGPPAVERGRRDAGPLDDRAHGQAAVALLAEHLDGGLEDGRVGRLAPVGGGGCLRRTGPDADGHEPPPGERSPTSSPVAPPVGLAGASSAAAISRTPSPLAKIIGAMPSIGLCASSRASPAWAGRYTNAKIAATATTRCGQEQRAAERVQERGVGRVGQRLAGLAAHRRRRVDGAADRVAGDGGDLAAAGSCWRWPHPWPAGTTRPAPTR